MLKLLIIAPYFDAEVPGESWSTYKWIEGLSRLCEVTVLTTHSRGWNSKGSPTGAVKLIDWPDVCLPHRFARINHEMAPGYAVFYHRARKWIKEKIRLGWNFDLVHQINPLALRYPSPAAGLGLLYVIGPLAGSLATPPGFSAEGTDRQWFRKLRQLDGLRLRYDPFLRGTYADAALVLGVAPYVKELLSESNLQRFAIMSETGVDTVPDERKTISAADEPLKLLFVGRIIRTKGVLDAIRAVAEASQFSSLRFDIIGDGDQLEECKREVLRLGIDGCVVFHGRIPRLEIDDFYRKADVFLFPSFREPSGNVVFEAMSHGLPVITSTLGGPGFLVTDACGIRVAPTTPGEYAMLLGAAIEKLAASRDLVAEMSTSARIRLSEVALWESKLRGLLDLYGEVLREESPIETQNGLPLAEKH